MINSTVVWKFLIMWMNFFKTWIKLKYLKYSRPVEVLGYAKVRGIYGETTFF